MAERRRRGVSIPPVSFLEGASITGTAAQIRAQFEKLGGGEASLALDESGSGQYPLSYDQRALWFVFVNRLLELSRGNNRRQTLTLMEQSGQPTLSTYARLERMMPPQRRAGSGASAVPAATR